MCLAQLTAAKEVLGTAAPAIEWVGDRFTQWQRDADRLRELEVNLRATRLEVETNLAAWKIKADHEWDFEWAKQASSSWKDEYLTILFTLPLILLFLPWTREFTLDGFNALKFFHEDAPTWFMAGNAVVVSAAFGMKQALQFMLPARFAALAGMMANVEDDIPDSAITPIPPNHTPKSTTK